MNYSPVNFKRNIRFRGADLLHELKRPPQICTASLDIYSFCFPASQTIVFQVNGGLCRITYALAVRLFITDFKPGPVKIISFRIHRLTALYCWFLSLQILHQIARQNKYSLFFGLAACADYSEEIGTLYVPLLYALK